MASGFCSSCWITRFSGRAPIGRVVAAGGDFVAGRVGDFQAAGRAAASSFCQPVELQVDDLADLLRDRADGRRSISSMRLRNSGRNRACSDFHHGRRASLRSVPPSSSDLLDHLAADVRGHHDDRVREIDRVAVAVGQPAVVEHLQQDVEHVAVGLFDFVEQHDASTAGGGPLRSACRLLRSRRSPAGRRSAG